MAVTLRSAGASPPTWLKAAAAALKTPACPVYQQTVSRITDPLPNAHARESAPLLCALTRLTVPPKADTALLFTLVDSTTTSRRVDPLPRKNPSPPVLDMLMTGLAPGAPWIVMFVIGVHPGVHTCPSSLDPLCE